MTDLSGKRVAVIVTDFVEEPELLVPRDELTKAGAEVRVFSVSGKAVQAVRNDTEPTEKVGADGSLADLDVTGFDALVVPGGTVNADNLRTEERAQEIVRTALDGDVVVAVICHGPWLLASADVVQGRRLTSWPSLSTDLRNAGGEWVDEEVVVDGNLITSRNPDDLPAFVEAIVSRLGG